MYYYVYEWLTRRNATGHGGRRACATFNVTCSGTNKSRYVLTRLSDQRESPPKDEAIVECSVSSVSIGVKFRGGLAEGVDPRLDDRTAPLTHQVRVLHERQPAAVLHVVREDSRHESIDRA